MEAIEASLAGDGEMRKRREIEAEQDRRRLEYRVAQQAGEIARLGEELERTVHEAGSAKRAKSTFLTNMSDEIRNPMNAIIGFVGLLRRRADLGADAQDMLGKIGDSARHLLSVLNDIIDYAKVEAGKVVLECAPFSPAELVGELSTLIGMRAKAKGLRFLVATNPLPPMLDGDTAHLRQALLNYLDNAVKFTEQGEIVLGARVLSQSDTEVTIRFTVEDTGIGVTAEQERHLFIPFEQADNTSTRRFGGTGLGLAINRHLAHLMGGEVGVERRPGGGSIFWLTARFARSKAA